MVSGEKTLSDAVDSDEEFENMISTQRDIVLSLIRARLGEADREFKAHWLSEMLNYAVLRQRRHHVAIFLDEIDQDRSLFTKYPWNMRSILETRSAAILRDVLIRYPEAVHTCNNPDCNPLLAIQDYQWPAGARLLAEAGGKILGKVPSKFVTLLWLSLEDRCRIVARRHIKLPLSKNVGLLPLPERVKRRLLYR